MTLEKSAGAVVFREEDKKRFYLVLHYEAGHWSFSKGNIEEGEGLKGTTIREVREETGIQDLEIVPGFKKHIRYTYFRPQNKKEPVFKVVTYFLARTKTKEIKISWEHTGFKWLPYEEALERLTYENARGVLRKAHRFLAKKINS